MPVFKKCVHMGEPGLNGSGPFSGSFPTPRLVAVGSTGGGAAPGAAVVCKYLQASAHLHTPVLWKKRHTSEPPVAEPVVGTSEAPAAAAGACVAAS
mmetsp:Transcript_34948/g.100341  ORF Transcript_34948/g.100341 Transcript_34948/m.100341 type:complete len:96 (+) Transcript_34948:605-892(+)